MLQHALGYDIGPFRGLGGAGRRKMVAMEYKKSPEL
jgi:hypothetical protein